MNRFLNPGEEKFSERRRFGRSLKTAKRMTRIGQEHPLTQNAGVLWDIQESFLMILYQNMTRYLGNPEKILEG